MNFIPYGKQWLDEQDVEAVVETLHSDYITTGPKVKAFEEAIANYGTSPCLAGSVGGR